MNNKSRIYPLIGLLIFVMVMAYFAHPDDAEAIPAFARKYKMSCTTCHAPVPRLKAYGDEFAGNGFVLKDQEATRYFVDTGDDQLNLIRDFPVAVRLEGFIKHQTVTDKEFDLTTPYNLKFLSGGSLTKNVAYYFYFFFSERGEVAGIEDAYIMFNDLFGQDFDVYLGQFQVPVKLMVGVRVVHFKSRSPVGQGIVSGLDQYVIRDQGPEEQFPVKIQFVAVFKARGRLFPEVIENA